MLCGGSLTVEKVALATFSTRRRTLRVFFYEAGGFFRGQIKEMPESSR